MSLSIRSFKVLTECPIIIVLLFQMGIPVVAANGVRRHLASEYIDDMLNHTINMLSLQANAQREAHEAAAARGEAFYGPSPKVPNQSLFSDFILAQVKVIFITDGRVCHSWRICYGRIGQRILFPALAFLNMSCVC